MFQVTVVELRHDMACEYMDQICPSRFINTISGANVRQESVYCRQMSFAKFTLERRCKQ